MTNPDKITGVALSEAIEGTLACSDVANAVDLTHSERVEFLNKGPNTVFFRTDGTVATAGAAGNGDQLISGQAVVIAGAKLTSGSFICKTAEAATLFYRLYV